jgi:hypothetical protein
MKSKGKTKFDYKSAIIITIIAIIIFCIFSVYFRVNSFDTFPVNYMGAVLSSLIGALITLVLLRGQTDIEEKKGKDIKILEKKAEVFQNYIKDVWKVWEDQKITIEEFKKLTSKYYQNLMIYLNDKRLKEIGEKLSMIGNNIGKDDKTAIDELRDSIIDIVNELSDELELGGQVNKKIMEEHARIVFPLLFKNQILEEANKVLPIDTIFEKGKFEPIKEFRNEPSMEYLCFDFIKYKGCKIAIKGFEGSEGEAVRLFLFIDTKYHKFDKFRISPPGGKYVHWINHAACDLLKTVVVDKEKDGENFPKINFTDEKSMEEYRTKIRGFAPIFAGRIKYWFEEIKIEGDNIHILEFLEKYYEEQT